MIDACRNNPETGRNGEDNVLTDDFSKGFKIRRSSSNGGQPRSVRLSMLVMWEREPMSGQRRVMESLVIHHLRLPNRVQIGRWRLSQR